MENSSQQDPYSITLENDLVITLPTSHHYSYDSMIGDITLSASDTITLSNTIDTLDINYDFGKIWEDKFPDFQVVKNMCEEYPALGKALENFKTIYELVKDDYDNKIINENK